MELTARQKTILVTVIEKYIESAEPVGSKLVLEKSGLKCSSATVRSELVELERLGYLAQPHTSAGRVPTSLGYRKYVNELMEAKNLSSDEVDIASDLTPENAGRIAAELTHLPAVSFTGARFVTAKRFDLIYLDQSSFIIVILLSDNTVKNKLIKLPFSFDESLIKRLGAVFNASFTGIAESAITPQLIESSERGAGDTLGLTSVIAGFLSETLRGAFNSQGVVSGGESLLKIPEFQDSDKAHRVMSYLSGDGVNMLGSIDDTSDVRVVIGAENAAEELRDTSVILASYDAGDGMRGVIGVVGPTRMDYSLVAAKLRFIADGLSKVLSGGSLPPAGFGKLMLREGDKDVKG